MKLPPCSPVPRLPARAPGVPQRPASPPVRLLPVAQPRSSASGSPRAAASHVEAALAAVRMPSPSRGPVRQPAVQRAAASASSLAGTPAGMVRYCCSDKFVQRHIAFTESSASEKAVSAMKHLQSRDICSVLVLTDAEARELYLAVQIWRTSSLASGEYWLKVTFSKCVEAKLSGVKVWTGAIEIQVGFDGEQLVHLAAIRGGS